MLRVSKDIQKKTGKQPLNEGVVGNSTRGVQLKGKSYAEQSAALSPSAGGYDTQLAAVQMRGAGDAANVHGVAAAGVQGSGGALPYLDKIQASFGSHDVSNVQAYSGGAAQSATQALGAHAYASGNKVAFNGSTDLHTSAHEAAHIVQQRGGVSLSGGVGQSGDSYEQHADAVADAVVQGKSAEGLLDKFAATSSVADAGVQRKESPVQFASQYDDWADLASYRPSAATQRGLDRRGMRVHKLEAGMGPISLDYYPVNITRMPTLNGRELPPSALLRMLRTNMNQFVDTGFGDFSGYGAADLAKLRSSNPEGAVVHIDMGVGLDADIANPDDGSVVSSGVRTSRNRQGRETGQDFIFSTVYAPDDGSHPVSGNRQFGFTNAGEGYTFYARGADRTTTVMDYAMSAIVFGCAHQLWLSFQRELANFVNAYGGAATVGRHTAARHDWSTVRRAIHRPTEGWVETSHDRRNDGMGGAAWGGA